MTVEMLCEIYVKVLITEFILCAPIIISYDVLPKKYEDICSKIILIFAGIAVIGFCGLAICAVWGMDLGM